VGGVKENFMNHRVKLGLVLLALFVTSGVSLAEEENSKFDSFLEAYTATWNTHNGDALAALFTADADLMIGNLPRITGRKAIGGWWKSYFSKVDQGRKREFELLSFRDIAPGVRLVNVGSKTSGETRHGEKLETRLARGTWVLVKISETWLIAAMRGLPAEDEHRLRPGIDR
jgi:uncharacterized protein (TIGR02246 family)